MLRVLITMMVNVQQEERKGDPVRELYVSIVCSTDGARFAAVAASEEECLAQVAFYVAGQAERQLWPAATARVRELLGAGDASAAVSEYFRHSGERWDREWLVTTVLDSHRPASAWSGPIPLPAPVNLEHSRTPAY